jgi:ribosomal protein L37E
MKKEIANKTEKETYIKCKKCGTEIFSITHGDLTSCKCGAVSVDGSKELVRVVGKPEDYEEIQK